MESQTTPALEFAFLKFILMTQGTLNLAYIDLCAFISIYISTNFITVNILTVLKRESVFGLIFRKY